MNSALFVHIMNGLRKGAVYQSPLHIFIILLITIFAAETFIMILLRFLAVRFWVEAFIDSSFLTITPNVEKVYGYTTEDICNGGSDIWFGRIHPEDLEYVKKRVWIIFQRE